MSKKSIKEKMYQGKCPICGKFFQIEKEKMILDGWCEECAGSLNKEHNPFKDIDFNTLMQN